MQTYNVTVRLGHLAFVGAAPFVHINLDFLLQKGVYQNMLNPPCIQIWENSSIVKVLYLDRPAQHLWEIYLNRYKSGRLFEKPQKAVTEYGMQFAPPDWEQN